MVEGRCLWGKGGINLKCSFRGQPVNGSIGNAAITLDLKGKGGKSTQKSPNQNKNSSPHSLPSRNFSIPPLFSSSPILYDPQEGGRVRN
jgi:hypothetical protein